MLASDDTASGGVLQLCLLESTRLSFNRRLQLAWLASAPAVAGETLEDASSQRTVAPRSTLFAWLVASPLPQVATDPFSYTSRGRPFAEARAPPFSSSTNPRTTLLKRAHIVR
jgi:hypothetical protein